MSHDSMDRRAKGPCWSPPVLSSKVLIPSRKADPSWPNYLLKVPLFSTTAVKIQLSHEFCSRHSQTKAVKEQVFIEDSIH